MTERNGAIRLSSLRLVAAILAGMLAGSIIVTPVGAHVTESVKHLINKHIKRTFYTKKQSNALFLTKTDATAQSGIVAGFKNGPGDVPSVPSVSQSEATIATLAIPAGNFAIFVKLYVEDLVDQPIVTCRLEAGTDTDQSVSSLIPFQTVISLQVVHTFASAGSAVVKCKDDLPAPNTTTKFNQLKITGIEQGSLSNVAIP